MSEKHEILVAFDETVGEKRRTILCVSFINDAFTSVELEPCTFGQVVNIIERIETEGITVLAKDYHPCHHAGESKKDVAFRHPPHTIKRIEIIRRRKREETDET